MLPIEKKKANAKERGMENLVNGERKSSPISGMALFISKPPPIRKNKQRKSIIINEAVQANFFLTE